MLVAILSDIHANHMALELVIQDAQARGVVEFWCLGDVIDFGWQPVEVLSILQPLIKLENWVMGNHDAFFAGILEPGNFSFGMESQIMMKHNRDQINLSQETIKEYTHSIFSPVHQPLKQKNIDGLVCYLTHSGFDWTKYKYLWFDRSPINDDVKLLHQKMKDYPAPTEKRKFWQKAVSPIHLLFFGHTHLPVLAYFDETNGELKTIKVRSGKKDLQKDCENSRYIVINPGSVGMPKDLQPYPSYVILDTENKQVIFRKLTDYQADRFTKGYRAVKRDIAQYLPNNLNKFEAENFIVKLEDQYKRALHPHFFKISQDWRDFYENRNNIE